MEFPSTKRDSDDASSSWGAEGDNESSFDYSYEETDGNRTLFITNCDFPQVERGEEQERTNFPELNVPLEIVAPTLAHAIGHQEPNQFFQYTHPSPASQCPLICLPKDLLNHLFTFLDACDLLRLEGTCRILRGGTERRWQSLASSITDPSTTGNARVRVLRFFWASQFARRMQECYKHEDTPDNKRAQDPLFRSPHHVEYFVLVITMDGDTIFEGFRVPQLKAEYNLPRKRLAIHFDTGLCLTRRPPTDPFAAFRRWVEVSTDYLLVTVVAMEKRCYMLQPVHIETSKAVPDDEWDQTVGMHFLRKFNVGERRHEWSR